MKENLIIYLISGKARHGKTTTANYIKEYYESINKKGVVTSYAKYIKMYAKELTNWDGSDENKPRELLQTLGTEIIRIKLNKNDFFLKRLDDDLDVYNEFVNVVIIDDVRLPIEMNYFLEKYPNRVKTIHIDRPNYDNGLSDNQNKHETELALDNYQNYDKLFINDSSLESLRNKVFNYLKGENL